MNQYDEAMCNLEEKFGKKDVLLSLSTISLLPDKEGTPVPAARLVDAFYEDGCFYTVSNATSNKMLQIEKNSNVAICFIVENFTSDGIGENLGWVCEEKNVSIMTKVRPIFADWYYDANNDEDLNTCLLRVRLTHGLWNDAHKGIRDEIDFVNKIAQRVYQNA